MALPHEVIPVANPYRLVSRELRPEKTVVRFPGSAAAIGRRELAVVAGPGALPDPEQAFALAERVSRAGARFFRAGIGKPHPSSDRFPGLGREGLKLLAEIRSHFGLLAVVEAVDPESLGLVEEYADLIEIGARSMQDFSLLKRAGRCSRPVLLRRGPAATLEEFLLAAEYVMNEGNGSVVLCESGVRTFADYTCNTLDLSVVPAVQRLSHLPILVDPSAGAGRRNMVMPLARAAVAVGADGLMVELHAGRDPARSDGAPSLAVPQFEQLLSEVREIAAAVGRSLGAPAYIEASATGS